MFFNLFLKIIYGQMQFLIDAGTQDLAWKLLSKTAEAKRIWQAGRKDSQMGLFHVSVWKSNLAWIAWPVSSLYIKRGGATKSETTEEVQEEEAATEISIDAAFRAIYRNWMAFSH